MDAMKHLSINRKTSHFLLLISAMVCGLFCFMGLCGVAYASESEQNELPEISADPSEPVDEPGASDPSVPPDDTSDVLFDDDSDATEGDGPDTNTDDEPDTTTDDGADAADPQSADISAPNDKLSSLADEKAALIDRKEAEQPTKGTWTNDKTSEYFYVGDKLFKGSIQIEGNWYRFDSSDGHMLRGPQYIDGKWYRYDAAEGRMLTGFQKFDGSTYFYDLWAGYMLMGPHHINANWYYFDPVAGYMYTGSTYIDGNWYWYDLWGGHMLFGWLNINGQMNYYNKYNGIHMFASNLLYQTCVMAQYMSSPSSYLLMVDSSSCYVTVLVRSPGGGWDPLFFWRCSPGAPATPTVKGFYSIGSRGYVFGSGFSCYWWVQFYGDYLFHSIVYRQGTLIPQEGVMGVQASHGCVRLELGNAKWVYDNIPSGTTVYSF